MKDTLSRKPPDRVIGCGNESVLQNRKSGKVAQNAVANAAEKVAEIVIHKDFIFFSDKNAVIRCHEFHGILKLPLSGIDISKCTFKRSLRIELHHADIFAVKNEQISNLG